MINEGTRDGLSSAEVAARLGVKLDTVYAYVSRGLLARRVGPDGRSTFAVMDVERLAARGRAPGATRPARAARRPVVVASSITTPTGTGFAYRGHDVAALCDTHTFEQVAELLWNPSAALAPGGAVPPAAGALPDQPESTPHARGRRERQAGEPVGLDQRAESAGVFPAGDRVDQPEGTPYARGRRERQAGEPVGAAAGSDRLDVTANEPGGAHDSVGARAGVPGGASDRLDVVVDDSAWTAPEGALALARAVAAALPASTRPFDRLRVVVAAVGASDELRSETSPAAVTAVGRSLIPTLVASLAPAAAAREGSIAARLVRALGARRARRQALVGLVDAALVLGADQGLVPSTVAARVAASVQADPYSVVVAGLGAIAGRLHGAACLGAEELLDEVARTGNPTGAIGARLRRGERIPGFGEASYPGGDPRAGLLLDRLLASGVGDPGAVDRALAVVEVMGSRGLPRPNVDFALAALTHVAGLVPGASEALIAVARCAGWLAHALEEYAHPSRFELAAVPVPA